MNLLPQEPLENVENPSGIRLGVQEMTRFGMREGDMEQIADFIERCLKKGQYVGEDVKAFRKGFQRVHYSFDDGAMAFNPCARRAEALP
jgi:glycine hydroxymethyltransferase